MVRNCVDVHLGQIVCDKDGVVDWCIVLREMPLTRFEECWPLPTESLAELPWNLNIVTLSLTLWPINSGVLTPFSSHTSHHPSQTPWLLWISYAIQKLMLDSCKMVEKQSEHSIRFYGIFCKFKAEILLHIVLLKCQIAFLKFTRCENQSLVGCIPITPVAVHLNLIS